ncbi:uncharacterized protein LOC112905517 [Agrilus planipennis]|uniref:Uncharacterized protein LOC112905517 n=1 Tax=Agrilus planipennis TaxID=224129 RepID=A0A7F5RD29_AGRPL|nr:uncharacterized protein LOC112905517 [Agrilus planipennis]
MTDHGGVESVRCFVSYHKGRLQEYHAGFLQKKNRESLSGLLISIIPQIFYVEKESSQYIEDGKKCEFILTPIDNSSGFLQSPRHSLPPNTTCHYHFKGQKHEVIWITFIKYYVAGEKVGNFGYDDCNVELQLWDGDFGESGKSKQKNALISRFCKDEKPKLCDHSLLRNATRTTRPCEMHESYISSGSELSISFSNRYGNVLLPVQFLLKYEFVDLFQEGYNMTSTCDRVFQGGTGKFSSPKTTFLYGRGGQENLRCSYMFEFPEDHRLKLTFTRATLAPCTLHPMSSSCPELGACISSDLWCDGLVHCPSGSDEQEVNCSINKGRFIIQVLTSSAVLAGLLTAIFIVATFIFWKRWKREKKTAITSVTDHTFLEFKTGFC